MADPIFDRQSMQGILLGTVIGAVTIAGAAALGQSGQRQVMVFQDDGGGPRFLHYSGPDMSELRTPDYVPKDLPIFNEKLRLGDVQRLVVQTLLEVYLDAFQTLSQKLPAPRSPMMELELGDGQDLPAGAGGTVDAAVREALENAGEISDLDIDVEGPGQVAIAVRARVGAEGDGIELDEGEGEDVEVVLEPDEEGGVPEANVFISVGGRGDIELPDEVREKLEEIARDMAEKIQVQLEEQEAAGVGPLADEQSAADAFEERQRYFEDLRAAVKKFERDKQGLKQSFDGEVQSQLSPEQLAGWPALERALTRSKTLPRGRLDGERTDLLETVKSLDLGEAELESVAAELEAYELALHQALVERNDYLRDAHARLDEAIQEGKKQKALSIADQAAKLRVAVRSVNERYTDSIAHRLSALESEAFKQRVQKRSYPRVYRTTRGQKAFAAAQKLADVDSDTMESIEALAGAYATELDLVNQRLRRTIRKHQPAESRRMVERVSAMMSGGDRTFVLDPDDDPIRAAFQKRGDLDERYMKQLYGMLTPDQVASLPKLPSKVRREPIVIQRGGE